MKRILPFLLVLMLGFGSCGTKTPNQTAANATPQTSDKAIGLDSQGHQLYQGDRGGRYYFSDSGNKTYIDTADDKLVGKDKNGRFIYQGERGGMYYYNDRGEKTYLQLHY